MAVMKLPRMHCHSRFDGSGNRKCIHIRLAIPTHWPQIIGMEPPTPPPSRHPALRWTLFALGVILLLLTPVVGPIPGPGGLICLAGGLTLVLQNSRWARRAFARAKRRWPRLGNLADRGLRRRSAKRRRERARNGEAR